MCLDHDVLHRIVLLLSLVIFHSLRLSFEPVSVNLDSVQQGCTTGVLNCRCTQYLPATKYPEPADPCVDASLTRRYGAALPGQIHSTPLGTVSLSVWALVGRA